MFVFVCVCLCVCICECVCEGQRSVLGNLAELERKGYLIEVISLNHTAFNTLYVCKCVCLYVCVYLCVCL